MNPSSFHGLKAHLSVSVQVLTTAIAVLISYELIYNLERDLDLNRHLNLRKAAQCDKESTETVYCRNARSFICKWLGEQVSRGKSLRNFRSPSNSVVEDDLMFCVYWFVVCCVHRPDFGAGSQTVGPNPGSNLRFKVFETINQRV
jgi:hypothetical protein